MIKRTKEARFGLRMAKDDKAEFEVDAARLGLSLGSWLVLAGLEKVKRDRSERKRLYGHGAHCVATAPASAPMLVGASPKHPRKR